MFGSNYNITISNYRIFEPEEVVDRFEGRKYSLCIPVDYWQVRFWRRETGLT